MDINNPLTKDFLLYTIERLRDKYSKSSEVIPNYTDKEIDELFNCIDRIYHGYYGTIEERLCGLMYNITKGHYLNNGNKRVALIITVVLYCFELSEFEELPINFIPELN